MDVLKRLPVASLLSIGAFTSYVASDTIVKFIGKGLPVEQIILFNKLVFLFVCLLAAWRGEGLRSFRTRKAGFHLGRGLLVIVNMLTVYYGLMHLPLANYYTINFTVPFMVALLSVLFLKERPSFDVWVAIVTGFIGVVIAVRPDSYDAQAWPLLPVVSLFAANLCFALYALTIKWGGKHESSAALVFYPELFTFLALLLYSFYRGGWTGDFRFVSLALLSGLFSAVAAIMLTAAYRRAMNALVAPFHYTQIVTGGLAGYFIWGDVPTASSLLGVVIIIGSGIYILRHSHAAAGVEAAGEAGAIEGQKVPVQ